MALAALVGTAYLLQSNTKKQQHQDQQQQQIAEIPAEAINQANAIVSCSNTTSDVINVSLQPIPIPTVTLESVETRKFFTALSQWNEFVQQFVAQIPESKTIDQEDLKKMREVAPMLRALNCWGKVMQTRKLIMQLITKQSC